MTLHSGSLRSKHINSEMPESKTKGQRARKMIDLRFSIFTCLCFLNRWVYETPLSISESWATPKDLGTCTKHLTSAILAPKNTYHRFSSFCWLDTFALYIQKLQLGSWIHGWSGDYLSHRHIVVLLPAVESKRQKHHSNTPTCDPETIPVESMKISDPTDSKNIGKILLCKASCNKWMDTLNMIFFHIFSAHLWSFIGPQCFQVHVFCARFPGHSSKGRPKQPNRSKQEDRMAVMALGFGVPQGWRGGES